MAKTDSNTKDVATIESHVCDQGHYGSSWCSNCRTTLTQPFPEKCPGCRKELVLGEPTYNMGGSDF